MQANVACLCFYIMPLNWVNIKGENRVRREEKHNILRTKLQIICKVLLCTLKIGVILWQKCSGNAPNLCQKWTNFEVFTWVMMSSNRVQPHQSLTHVQCSICFHIDSYSSPSIGAQDCVRLHFSLQNTHFLMLSLLKLESEKRKSGEAANGVNCVNVTRIGI